MNSKQRRHKRRALEREFPYIVAVGSRYVSEQEFRRYRNQRDWLSANLKEDVDFKYIDGYRHPYMAKTISSVGGETIIMFKREEDAAMCGLMA